MRLLILGFFGEGNLGDEAILEGLLAALPPHARISVTVGAGSRYRGLHPLPRRGLASWPAFLRAAKRSTHLVTAGGILQDWSYDGTLFFALRLIAAHFFGCRVGLFGAGLGPLRHPSCRRLARAALERTEVAWLRHAEDVSFLASHFSLQGLLGTDWSWNLPSTGSAAVGTSGPGHFGINLRPWMDRICVQRAVAAAKQLIHGREAMGLSARREDEQILQRRFSGVTTRSFASFQALVEFCGRTLSGGLGMRYHVIMALLRAQTPVLPVAYDEKVAHLCRDAGIEPLTAANADLLPLQRAQPDFRERNERRLHQMKLGLQRFLHEPRRADIRQ